ncbi:MAG TPA: VOC family protein [Streptosporangiaceae bacterium]|nr:VOC family protein [Streptosporangiaceae bacterium]
MPAMTEYPPGTPCWVDLSTGDPAASAAFYTGLFGWEAQVAPPGGDTAYTFFAPAGIPPAGFTSQVVAGLMPSPGSHRAAWNTYISVTDAVAAATRVTQAGGRVAAPPAEVPGQGTMAMFADDQGAMFAVWQPAAFRGAGQVNAPGCFCWSELACRDTTAAGAFYGSVFGWEPDTSEMGPMTYTEWRLAGRAVGGMAHMDEEWPQGIPPRWVVYFAVADCDAAAARAAELGGQVTVPPADAPPGRLAVLTDPQGAAFTIIRLAAAAG